MTQTRVSILKRVCRPAERAVMVPSGTLPLSLGPLDGLTSDEAIPLIFAQEGGLQRLVNEHFEHWQDIEYSPVWEAALCMGCLTIK